MKTRLLNNPWGGDHVAPHAGKTFRTEREQQTHEIRKDQNNRRPVRRAGAQTKEGQDCTRIADTSRSEVPGMVSAAVNEGKVPPQANTSTLQSAEDAL